MRDIQQAAAGAIDWAQPWADRLARFGYAAKGIVLLMVGSLAMLAAAGGGKATDPYGALLEVGRAPAGRVLLVAIAAGLLCHALFRITLAFAGEPYAEANPTARAELARRLAYAGSAMIHIGLAGTAAALGLGWMALGQRGGDAEAREGASQLLHLPFGRFVLGAVALAVLVAALIYTARALGRDNVLRRLRVEEMTAAQCRAMVFLGRVAYLARAVVMSLIGYFLARAALDATPRAARGTAGALQALRTQPEGTILLGIVAAGLIAFALFVLMEARWRRLFWR